MKIKLLLVSITFAFLFFACDEDSPKNDVNNKTDRKGFPIMSGSDDNDAEIVINGDTLLYDAGADGDGKAYLKDKNGRKKMELNFSDTKENGDGKFSVKNEDGEDVISIDLGKLKSKVEQIEQKEKQ